MAQDCDALVIGGGHNGLVCAAYLADAGLKVTVLERRHVAGGAAVTEEFHPGFRNSVASYTVSLLNPKVIHDLDLHAHGLRIVERELANFLPTADGRYLRAGGERTKGEIAKFSAKDAERLDAYTARMEMLADVLRELVLTTPPNVVEGGWRALLPELIRAARVSRGVRKLPAARKQDLLTLFAASAGDYLDGWFESEPIKALYGFDSIVGNYASPYSPGSAYVLLHHAFGSVNGKKGVVGPRHRRHGRDHAGDGESGRGAGRRDSREFAGARGARRARQSGRRGDRVWRRVSRAHRDLEPPPEAVLSPAARSERAACGVSRAHRALAQRLGHVSNELGAVRAARFSLLARQDARAAPHRRDHHCADAALHGAGIFRRAHARLVAAADRRDADSVDARRQPGARRPARRELVLPTHGTGAAEWANLGICIASTSRI